MDARTVSAKEHRAEAAKPSIDDVAEEAVAHCFVNFVGIEPDETPLDYARKAGKVAVAHAIATGLVTVNRPAKP